MAELDAEVRRFLDNLANSGVLPYHLQTVERARQSLLDQIMSMTNPTAMFQVSDFNAIGPVSLVPIRLYRPSADSSLPLIVYFHGGGWVLGNIETHDSIARQLASSTGCAVASVDYRLAPEHRFPAAVEDAYASVEWLAAHAQDLDLDRSRLAVAGDSAGGNLAAVVSIVSRDRSGPAIALQVLRYPCVDFRFDTLSYLKFATGYQLSRADMQWYRSLYLANEADCINPHAAPLNCTDLSGLPRAIVATAEYDVLCDEGRAYSDALTKAGTKVEYRCFAGLIHGFFGMTATIPRAAEASLELATLIQGALSFEPARRAD